MIILDTDICTLLGYRHTNVTKKFDEVPKEETVAITIITRMEVLKGRTASVLTAADEVELAIAAERLRKAEELLHDFQLVQIDAEAIRQFGILRKQKKLNKMQRTDMLIASIALAQKALLVTRNTKDFEKVPGLMFANWADD